MHNKLSPDLIKQIKKSKGRVVDVASRLGVSIAAVSRYRPTRRKHLTDLEQDQIIAEWISGVRTKETAERLGVAVNTIQNARRRAMATLIGEKSNGSA